MPGGRPTVWNPELEERILAAIEAGDSERVAAECQDIDYDTFRLHKREDSSFFTRCQRARSAGIATVRRELMETDDPVRAKVRLHFLACKDRDEWAQEHRVRHTGSIGIMEALATPVMPDADGGD